MGKNLDLTKEVLRHSEFEITDFVKSGRNSIVVKVNNQRNKEGLPALGYDWFNYGGITRDVNLILTPRHFIEDYFIQLGKHSFKEIDGWVKLNGIHSIQDVRILIPELKLNKIFKSSQDGMVPVNFSAAFQLWSPRKSKAV